MFSTLKEELESCLKTGKYSNLFLKEYSQYIENGIYEPDFIGNEIKYLEGIEAFSETKNEAPFKGNLLKGLWHKHFFDAHNIYANCLKLLNDNYDRINKRTKGNDKAFLKEILELFKKSVISHNKTGDWIIYKKTESGNYYLTIARHSESDKTIYTRIKKYLA